MRAARTIGRLRVLPLTLLIACSADVAAPPSEPVPVSSVAVSSGSAGNIVVGNTMQLTATLRDASGQAVTGRTVTWASSDTTALKVSVAGVATGVFPGNATVTATSEGRSGSLALTVAAPTLPQATGGFTGYFTGTMAAPPAGFGYGFSRYSMVHTVQATPLANMQFGITTWIMPDNRSFNSPLCPVGTYARDHWPERGPSYRDVYQTIEGGLGTYAGARFPTGALKMHAGGTVNCYTWTQGNPAWGSGGVLLTANQTGMAVLGNRLLIPPDGTNFSALGLVGIGWLALPIIPAYTSALGVPTGDRSPTLFLNSTNFKGPVTFFTNAAYSQINEVDKTGVGRGLDAQPMFSGSIGMEIGGTRWIGATKDNVRYARVPKMSYATDANGRATFNQDMSYYGRSAIWDAVSAWMDGGAPATAINAGAALAVAPANPTAGLTLDARQVRYDTAAFATRVFSTGGSGTAIGLGWGTSSAFQRGVIPEYYRLDGTTWTPVAEAAVPRDTWLVDQTFAPSAGNTPYADATVLYPQATWKSGPFSVRLLDGSTLDYVWVKFIDQIAITRLNLSAAVLQRMQAWVESLHERSGVNGITIPGPTGGQLATIDPAQIVTPPAGLEKGYVPIVIRQR
jgi:hypothetical protein